MHLHNAVVLALSHTHPIALMSLPRNVLTFSGMPVFHNFYGPIALDYLSASTLCRSYIVI